MSCRLPWATASRGPNWPRRQRSFRSGTDVISRNAEETWRRESDETLSSFALNPVAALAASGRNPLGCTSAIAARPQQPRRLGWATVYPTLASFGASESAISRCASNERPTQDPRQVRKAGRMWRDRHDETRRKTHVRHEHPVQADPSTQRGSRQVPEHSRNHSIST